MFNNRLRLRSYQPVGKVVSGKLCVPLAMPIGIYTFLIHKMGDARELPEILG